MADFRAEVERRDRAGREVIEQRLTDLDQARAGAAGALTAALASEREYILGQITNALAETRRVGDVSQEKFAAVDALFAVQRPRPGRRAGRARRRPWPRRTTPTPSPSPSARVSTKETISANAATAQTGLSSLANQVSDIKDRVVRIESTGVGIAGQRGEQRASIGTVIAAVATLIAVVSFVLLIVKK